MVLELIVNYLIQIFIFIGIIYIFGYLIFLINKALIKLGFNYKLYIYTGVVGTVIHEASHALMCLLFFHKITDIKLFSPSDDGTLGYVSHSYNKKNIYQKIGNFFIGIAPILGGTAVIYLLLYLFMPDNCIIIINNNLNLYESIIIGDYKNILNYFLSTIKTIFNDFTDWKLYVFLILSSFICLHMNLSGADVKGSLIAIPYILIIVLIIDLFLYFILNDIYNIFFKFCLNLGIYIFAFLFISLFLSLIVLLLYLLIYFIIKLFKKN